MTYTKILLENRACSECGSMYRPRNRVAKRCHACAVKRCANRGVYDVGTFVVVSAPDGYEEMKDRQGTLAHFRQFNLVGMVLRNKVDGKFCVFCRSGGFSKCDDPRIPARQPGNDGSRYGVKIIQRAPVYVTSTASDEL